jgi:PAS domain S-box-containing protein
MTNPGAVSLTPAQFDSVFPFHFVVDANLRVVQVGRSLCRLCPDLKPGALLGEHLVDGATNQPVGREKLVAQSEQLRVFRSLRGNVILRGQVKPVADTQNLMFIGSPWITSPHMLAELGLSVSDFAVHDPVIDVLQLMQSQATALDDTRRLASYLKKQSTELQTINDRLRVSEAEARKLALIASRTDNAVVLTDSRGFIEWVNEGFTRLTGYTLAEVLGQAPGAFLQGPETDRQTTARIGECLRTGLPFSETLLNYHKSGRKYWLSVDGQPIYDDQGNITHYMAIERDVTAMKTSEIALRESEERYRALVNSLSEVVYQTDTEGRWTFLSPSWRDLTGYFPDESMGRPMLDLARPDSRETAQAALESLLPEQSPISTSEFIMRLRTASGRQKYVEVVCHRRFDAVGSFVGLTGLLTDVSDRVTAELRANRLSQLQQITQRVISAFLVDDDLSRCIQLILREAGTFLDVSRAYLFRYRQGLRRLSNTHEWVAEGVEPQSPRLRELPGDDFPWWTRHLSEGQPIVLRSVEGDAPPEVRSMLMAQGIRALLVLPVAINGKLEGFIGFDETRAPRIWQEEEIALLQTMVESLSRAIERRVAERAMQEQQARLTEFVEHAPAAIAMLDRDMRYIAVSRAWLHLYNVVDSSVLGRSHYEVFPGTSEDWKAVHRRALAGNIEKSDEDAAGPAGTHGGQILRWEVRPWIDATGAIGGIMILTEDITERKRREIELARLRDAAESASVSKTQFLANVSHELRTPMAAIIGFSKLLARGAGAPSEQNDWAVSIQRNAQHLLALLNDLLDLSKIEAGQLQLASETIDVIPVITEAVEMLRPQAKEKLLPIELSGPSGPVVASTDAVRLRQIVFNLVSNAIKYTDHGSVSIDITVIEAAGERQLRIAVNDTGIGIEPDRAHVVFEPFGLADAETSRRRGGIGLGLSICRRIAAALGGAVSFTSNPGVGSTFVFEMPLPPTAAVHPSDQDRLPAVHPHPAPASLAGRRILLVEDFPENQKLLAFLLRERGAEVQIAGDGEQGVAAAVAARASGRSIDLILMDMQMPVLDGYAATSQLRSLGITTPIIALTAYAMAEDRRHCLAAGCSEYISKPIVESVLFGTIGRLLSQPVDTPPTQPPTPTATPPVTPPAPRPWFEQLKLDFAASLPGLAEQIRAALARSDPQAVGVIAHKLRGTASSFDLSPVARAAATCEDALRLHPAANTWRTAADDLITEIQRSTTSTRPPA